ncbi:MAG TPA: hypothetical protein VIM84_01270, partial [Gemmatimonadales bacterium]
PILTADRGGVAETVTRSGAGATFESGNASALSETAIRMITGDLRPLGVAGRSYVESHHGWPQVFDRLFSVYRGILSR